MCYTGHIFLWNRVYIGIDGSVSQVCTGTMKIHVCLNKPSHDIPFANHCCCLNQSLHIPLQWILNYSGKGGRAINHMSVGILFHHCMRNYLGISTCEYPSLISNPKIYSYVPSSRQSTIAWLQSYTLLFLVTYCICMYCYAHIWGDYYINVFRVQIKYHILNQIVGGECIMWWLTSIFLIW